MAKVTFTSSVAGIRGKVDRWVFREQNGRTVVVPHRDRKDQPSGAQLDRRARFRDAQTYAAGVLADPLKREAYRRLAAARKCPPNALLISNFLNPPVLERVDFSGYQAAAGDPVRLLAGDAIEVAGVTLTVRNATGDTLESGPAERDHDVWVYRCQSAHAPHAPVRFAITARNRAGAEVTEEFLPA